MPRVVHFEIHATDPEALVSFYTGLFGWKISRWGEMPYWLEVETGAEGDSASSGLLRRMGRAGVTGRR
jgi:predicted enzyme related to lactoylglutathione lyase